MQTTALQRTNPAGRNLAKNLPQRALFSLAPLLSGDGSSETVALAILDRQRGLTPVLAMQSPQISGLIKEETGAMETAQALSNALLYTAHQFNVVRNMATLQMGILADELLELYWYWRFDEFLYVLKEGVRQTWGKTYDRLDPPTVHGWCKEYEQVRDTIVEHEASRRHLGYKKTERAFQSRLATDPEARVLRADLDHFDTQTLVDGLAYYEHRWREVAGSACTCDVDGVPYYEANPCLPEAELRKLAVVTELVAQRRAAHYLAQFGQQFPAANEAEQQDKEASFHREKMAWITQKATKPKQFTPYS